MITAIREFLGGTGYDAADAIDTMHADDAAIIEGLRAEIQRLEAKLAVQPTKLVPVLFSDLGKRIPCTIERDEYNRGHVIRISQATLYDLARPK
jgi:hypothetical protein